MTFYQQIKVPKSRLCLICSQFFVAHFTHLIKKTIWRQKLTPLESRDLLDHPIIMLISSESEKFKLQKKNSVECTYTRFYNQKE